MAHNIARIGGQAAMAFVGANPWHGLGQRMQADVTVDDALKAASLDWTVHTEPLYLAGGQAAPRVAIVRATDTGSVILGTATERYRPIQNVEAFGVLQDAMGLHGLQIKTAGALGSGERVWMLAAMPEQIIVAAQGGEDAINGYLLITSAHDGSGADSMQFTPIRVVCQNTLSAAVSSGTTSMAIRHTASATVRLKQAERMIERAIAVAKETGATFKQLAERQMSERELRAYIEAVFPTPADEKPSTQLRRRRLAVEQLYYQGRGHELSGTTAWGAYNAVTEYLDHVRVREAKTADAVKRAQVSTLFGGGMAIKALALAQARQLVMA